MTNPKPSIRNYRDPREQRYTASCINDVYRHLIEDKRGIFRKNYVANSLPKYRDRGDHQDEFTQDLMEHLHLKYQDKPDELLHLFNTTFNYFYTSFCRRRMGTIDGKHNRKFKEKYASLDAEDFHHQPQAHHDTAFDFDDDPIIGLRLSDPEVIEFLLSTKHFAHYSKEDLNIYRQWFDKTRDDLKRVNVAELARTLGLNEGRTRTLIDGINRILRQRIKHIQSL